MKACEPSNNIDCDCTSTNLSAVGLSLPKVGNDFPFRAFVGGSNLQVSQTQDEIVLSIVKNTNRVYIGYPQTVLTGLQNIPLIFTDTSIPGYVNTGMYSAGITTIPVTGMYHIMVQLSTQVDINPAEFSRIINIYVNAILLNLVTYKTSFETNNMVIMCSVLYPLNAGDLVQIHASIGMMNSAPYIINADSYLSICQT